VRERLYSLRLYRYRLRRGNRTKFGRSGDWSRFFSRCRFDCRWLRLGNGNRLRLGSNRSRLDVWDRFDFYRLRRSNVRNRTSNQFRHKLRGRLFEGYRLGNRSYRKLR